MTQKKRNEYKNRYKRVCVRTTINEMTIDQFTPSCHKL